jgi:hypothetical protein
LACLQRVLTRQTSAACVVLLIVAGSLDRASAQRAEKTPTPTVDQGGFTIAVSYSKKAMDALIARKETVIVAGYLSAFPKQGTPKRYVDHMGEIGLGQVKDEVAAGSPATFGTVKLDQSMLKWVDSQGPQLLINVYSGRKSSQNNLLDCGIYEGPLKDAQGKTLPIACKMIGEQ